MDVIMPQMGESVNEGTVAAWYKKVGDQVKKDETLVDIETDKAAIEVPAPADGVLSAINLQEGEEGEVGVVICVITVEGEEAAAAPAEEPKAAPAEAAPDEEAPASAAAAPAPAASEADTSGNPLAAQPGSKLSPAVRRLVAENGLNISSISGTGKGGRITRNDVVAFIDGGGASAPAPAAAPAA
ncbi:MAG: 2-oxoglutarate dehydrogenase, E2 component, dihydrolipoamide succinyltransferase, partial [Porticoccaceae bacterium]|nr:2-oxoglutarate dehydrogenase, E2 component, dihydrolipoamide succinyltransferase [Porticoccaceae bacterium]